MSAQREDVVLHVLEGELEVVVDRERRRSRPGETRDARPRRAAPAERRRERSRVLALIAPAGLEELLIDRRRPATDPDDRAALLAVGGVQARARGMTGRTTRIVLVDDHVLVRSGMKALLDAQPDLEVTGEAGDGAEGVELALAAPPRRRADGPADAGARRHRGHAADRRRRLAARASSSSPATTTTRSCCARCAPARPASSSRTPPPTGSREAVRAVAAGDTLLAPPIARRLVESAARRARRPRSRSGRASTTLTERERDIVRRLARGLSNAALAHELGLSEATVKTHVTRLLTKLGVRSRVQAVVLAYESGFVRPGHTGELEL